MGERQSYRLLRWLIVAAMLVIGMSVMWLAKPVYAAEETKIRVGYFAFEGYHNQDADGNRSGYGYEYLQQMARYTGWTYDYLGYDKSWSEAQKMLENGEIDLLTSAQKTPERELKFDFSNDPIGYSSTIFTIKAGNNKYTIDNFSTFEGIRVGMIDGNSRNQEFANFAQEKGFGYTPVMFTDTDELVKALQDGTIDSIVTSSLRATKGEWVVSEFGFSPYYVCVKKGNTALLNQVNDAIGKLNQNNPSLQNELENKYYGADSEDAVAFTEEERNYINQRKRSNTELKVMINPDRAPLSEYDGKSMSGIYGKAAEKILQKSGLPYSVVVPKNRKEYEKLRKDHAVDLCMDMRNDFNQAEVLGYRLTDTYDSADISMVTLRSNGDSIKSVAAVTNSDLATELQTHISDGVTLVQYDTAKACIDAVRSGKQDATYLYTYVAEHQMQNDASHQLTTTLVPDFTTDFCVGIGKISDTILFSIINKSVTSLDKGWMDEQTMIYTQSETDTMSLVDLAYTHPMAVLAVVALILILIGAIIILVLRRNAEKKDEERAKEIERLFHYVCSTNERVLEINLDSMTCREFRIEDNRLVTDDRPYHFDMKDQPAIMPEDFEKHMENLTEEKVNALINQGEEYVFEARGQADDGSWRWYLYTIHGMVPDEKHPKNIMLFKSDINAIKVKDEESRAALTDALATAKEASAAKGDFMSRMSHEIRTPLNAVIGYLDIAQDGGSDADKITHCLEQSSVAARHLLSIINDVLDISSIESGRMKIANDDFDITQLIQSLTTIFYAQAREKNVDFEVSVKDLSEEWIRGDALRINQILLNLLSNAIKFTAEGGSVRLVIHQMGIHDGQVHMQFKVIDTGIGMSEEYRSRMFTPFEQESATTAKRFGGTGLGLSISYNLVKMMGGDIAVESEQGVGTTFTVALAFGKSKDHHDSNLATESFSKLRALVVDDEDSACEYVQRLMGRCGVRCDTVNTGKKALRRIRNRLSSGAAYDLCIVDWNMKGMDGLETAKEIRALCGEDLPIIIATAYDYSSIVDDAKKVGVNKIISKPLFQSTLFDLLVNTYGKYEPKAEEQAPAVNFNGLRVILAEDNDMNMEIAMDILSKAGMVVTPAVNGKEALDTFTQSEENSFDAILMDIQMPIMDGYEATRAIRKSTHPQAKSIPIIAMTANAFTADVTAALSAGMNDHISKPVSYQHLFEALTRLTHKNQIS